jgi:hypothetical protein
MNGEILLALLEFMALTLQTVQLGRMEAGLLC